MTTRHDVSAVRPQGAYIAKRCPVRIQNDVLRPVEPLPVGPEARLRMDEGVAFEAEVFAELRGLARRGWVFVDESRDGDDAIIETIAAMAAGAELIAGGFLPLDEAGRRTGRPDLLLRAPGGYVPVDVKHHRTLDVDDSGSVATSPLTEPFLDAAAPRTGWLRRKHRDDALQLAHYRRMLEAAGYAADAAAGGIIGKEKEVVWYDLDEPLWQTPAKSGGRKRKTRSTIDVYDFEFSFRLDIAAVAQQHVGDAGTDLLVVPLRCGECAECPWREHCDETLLAGSGDPSLLPGVGYREWAMLREGGVADRAGVAALQYPAARLAADGVDLARLLAEAQGVPSDTAVAALIPHASKQQRLLAEAEIATVADLRASIDATTAVIAGSGFLPKAILDARAVTGDAPVYRRPGTISGAVPRADLEIDVDMENTNDGTYLWGVLVTDRAQTGLADDGYRPFVSWEPMIEATERDVFERFWAWLFDLQARAGEAGVTLKAYCWHESAENTQMRRIAADTDLARPVADFIASERWVDMQRVFKDSWITGGSTGLKMIAPLAGYRWPVDDPGGGLSMVRHAEATAAPADAEARTWILDYNRGDVEATAAIREWLDREGASWPQIDVG